MKKIIYLIVIISAVIFQSCHTEIKINTEESDSKTDTNSIKVGVFQGTGAGETSVIETIEALRIDKDIDAFPVKARDIMDGKLNQVDVLFFPGGSGSKQLNTLGKQGKQKVIDYVKNGHNVIGICAGAYMLCSTPGYPSLQLGDVKHLDRPHYARGRGLIEFALNDKGLEIFPELKNHRQFIQYYDGPIMEALHKDPSFTPLATYVSDIHPNEGDPVGLTPGKLFIYTENIGKGKIFAIGGHAESTPGMRWMIPRMARWVAGKGIVAYNKKWVRPEINDKEILFYPETKKTESKYWWQLFEKNPEIQLAAMDSLYALRSRPFVRWSIGLLRDTNPKVRAKAAEILGLTEYTDAIPDLKVALKMEKDEDTKQKIKKALELLDLNR